MTGAATNRTAPVPAANATSDAIAPADVPAPPDAVPSPADLGSVIPADTSGSTIASDAPPGHPSVASSPLPARPDLRSATRHAAHGPPALLLSALVAGALVVVVAGVLGAWVRRHPNGWRSVGIRRSTAVGP